MDDLHDRSALNTPMQGLTPNIFLKHSHDLPQHHITDKMDFGIVFSVKHMSDDYVIN